MYTVKIKNLANYARQVQYYKINRYIVLKPYEEVSIECDDISDVVYYNLLKNKQFSVDVVNDNQRDQQTVKKTAEAPVKKKPYIPPEITIIENTDSTPIEEHTETVAEIIEDTGDTTDVEDKAILEETVEKGITLDDLTDMQLKTVIKNLGITTTLRARHKLIDLINLNLPDGADLKDYLK